MTTTRRLIRIGLAGVCAVGVIYAASLCYDTVMGRAEWYWITRSVTVVREGSPIDTWVHRTRDGSMILVTLRGRAPQSYSIYVPVHAPPSVAVCEGWAAPRLPVLVQREEIGESAGCWRISRPSLQRGDNFVLFKAEDGHRLRVSW